jgi:hypothetical protein
MSSHTWAKEMERSGQEGSHVGDRRHREIWSSMHGLRLDSFLLMLLMGAGSGRLLGKLTVITRASISVEHLR